MTKRNVLGQAAQIGLADLLRRVCSCVNGYAVYDDGWDDQRVMEATPGTNLTNVQGMRRRLIGDLQQYAKTSKTEEIAARVELLETNLVQRVQFLEAEGSLVQRVQKLEQELSAETARVAELTSEITELTRAFSAFFGKTRVEIISMDDLMADLKSLSLASGARVKTPFKKRVEQQPLPGLFATAK